MSSLIGTGVALVTPFQEDGEIDFAGLENLVNFSIEGGVEFLVLLGTTAETATLSKKEKKEVVSAIKQFNNKRLPMVIGIGGNNTAEVVEQIESTDLSDFESVLSVSPAYNKPTQEGIYQHFKAIAESTDKEIILYNVPGRTSSNMEASTTLKLARDFSNITSIKEASPNFLQSMDILRNKPEGFSVFSGDDEYALPMTLAGGKGVISVIGQGIPEIFTDMIRLGLDKNVEEAYRLNFKVTDIIRSIFAEGNPAGIKSLLSLRGVCQPYTRLPLVPASSDLTRKMAELLEDLNVLNNIKV